MLKNVFLFAMLLGTFACVSSGPKMSAMQRRSIQTKMFEQTTYDNVFRAFKTVLQDEGYVIKNQDLQGGLIVAANEKAVSSWGAVFAGSNNNHKTGEGFEVSVNLEDLGKGNVETRLIIQKQESYSMGGKRGYQLDQPELYKNIYQKVVVEVNRRNMMGRK